MIPERTGRTRDGKRVEISWITVENPNEKRDFLK